MSKIIYQNRALSSCYNPETTTTTLKLKLAAATFNDLFFQNSAPIEKQSFYTHPFVNTSYSRLSAKSLELCTEYLGSETGSDIISSISNSSTHLDFKLEEPKQRTKSLNKPEKIKSCRKIKNFPPPLSTLRGSKSLLQVRRYREDGRLIIEAVEVPIMNPCLQAERSNGRLRIFVNKEQKEEEDLETENEATDDGELNVEIGMKKLGRMMSRCNGSETLCSNWKPALWVATS